jgi:hypothetical protein
MKTYILPHKSGLSLCIAKLQPNFFFKCCSRDTQARQKLKLNCQIFFKILLHPYHNKRPGENLRK